MNKKFKFDIQLNNDTEVSLDMDSIKVCEERIDLNQIAVCVTDPTPIIILFGPACSGKTMALIRLTRYLRKNGYIVEPDRVFRSSTDIYYANLCDTFSQMVDSDEAAPASNNLGFMLVKSTANLFAKY
jgi:Ni2+-binding GTPase involved in maturation of urease and hydrogenase